MKTIFASKILGQLLGLHNRIQTTFLAFVYYEKAFDSAEDAVVFNLSRDQDIKENKKEYCG